MIRVKQTELDGVLLIQPDWFEDQRGEFVETYNEKWYKCVGIDADFVQDCFSYSVRHVLRGIHVEPEMAKLVSCPLGRIYVVVVNKQTCKWQSFVLSQHNKKQVYVPAGYGLGHLVLSEEAILHYKKTGYYSPHTQLTYRFDDPRFGIWWPIKEPILSRRDAAAWPDLRVTKSDERCR